jgi:peptidoglycan/xylan/chitin deacetylase (PgdA/CDA1 family)
MVSARDIGAERQSAFGRWRPAPAIRISAAVHLAGVAAVALDPLSWPYIGAALVANHAALGLGVMMPRSTILGPNLSSLPQASALRGEIALTFDDGPDPAVTPRILDLLDRYGAKASFFCIGRKAAAYPEIVREIARRGHSVENHSNRHPNGFAGYGLRRLARDIEAAQETLGFLSGRAPAFFRAPMGLRSLFLDPVLARLGLTYVSWTRRGLDTVDGDPATVLARLIRELSAGDILLLHDAAGTLLRRDTAVAVSVLPVLMERIAAAGLKPVSLRTAYRDLAARQSSRAHGIF